MLEGRFIKHYCFSIHVLLLSFTCHVHIQLLMLRRMDSDTFSDPLERSELLLALMGSASQLIAAFEIIGRAMPSSNVVNLI